MYTSPGPERRADAGRVQRGAIANRRTLGCYGLAPANTPPVLGRRKFINMKSSSHAEMNEGASALDRFRKAMKTIVSVPKNAVVPARKKTNKEKGSQVVNRLSFGASRASAGSSSFGVRLTNLSASVARHGGKGETLANDALQRQRKPQRIRTGPLIESERLFIEITEQMKRFDGYVGALDRTLQQRPEIFQLFV